VKASLILLLSSSPCRLVFDDDTTFSTLLPVVNSTSTPYSPPNDTSQDRPCPRRHPTLRTTTTSSASALTRHILMAMNRRLKAQRALNSGARINWRCWVRILIRRALLLLLRVWVRQL